MNDVQARLTRCFSAVFPELRVEEIRCATPSSVQGWDSIASVTLLSLIAEEFGTDILNAEETTELSFAAILQDLERQPRTADGPADSDR